MYLQRLVLPETYGELLICGGTNWSVNGRKQPKKGDGVFLVKTGYSFWKLGYSLFFNDFEFWYTLSVKTALKTDASLA